MRGCVIYLCWAALDHFIQLNRYQKVESGPPRSPSDNIPIPPVSECKDKAGSHLKEAWLSSGGHQEPVPGMRIEVKFGDGTWYPGTIDDYTEKNVGMQNHANLQAPMFQIHIKYDDGDDEWTDYPSPDGDIRPLLGDDTNVKVGMSRAHLEVTQSPSQKKTTTKSSTDECGTVKPCEPTSCLADTRKFKVSNEAPVTSKASTTTTVKKESKKSKALKSETGQYTKKTINANADAITTTNMEMPKVDPAEITEGNPSHVDKANQKKNEMLDGQRIVANEVGKDQVIDARKFLSGKAKTQSQSPHPVYASGSHLAHIRSPVILEESQCIGDKQYKKAPWAASILSISHRRGDEGDEGDEGDMTAPFSARGVNEDQAQVCGWLQKLFRNDWKCYLAKFIPYGVTDLTFIAELEDKDLKEMGLLSIIPPLHLKRLRRAIRAERNREEYVSGS